MEKHRIYELAKELNTTSKRLIEKLDEININVKNHMSLLEEDELKALYNHIGVITHKDEKNEAEAVKETQKKPESLRATGQSQSKQIPRIIRKTEIIIDSDRNTDITNEKSFNSFKKNKREKRQDFVKVADDTSGLMAGYRRDAGDLYKTFKNNKIKPVNEDLKQNTVEIKTQENEIKQQVKPEENNEKISSIVNKTEPDIKSGIRHDKEHGLKHELKQGTKSEVKHEVKHETVKESRPDMGRETRPDMGRQTRPDTGRETRPDTRRETRPDTGRVTRPDTGRVTKPEYKKDYKTGAANISNTQNRQEHYKKDFSGQPATGHYKDSAPDTRQEFKNKGEKDYPKKKPVLEIPKPEAITNKNEKEAVRTKHTPFNKDFTKNTKDDKREIPRLQPVKKNKYNPGNIFTGQKKNVSEILSTDVVDSGFEELYDNNGRKKRPVKNRRDEGIKTKYIPPRAILTSIKVPVTISVKELSERLKKTSTEVIKKLMLSGMMVTLNEEIDFETASIIADEFGIKVFKEIVINEEDILFDEREDADSLMESRAPVVVVMGHVDHGKTSLLDAIREENVLATEAGGITQHIGAYMVKINGRDITFLDTPGHEAFTSLRARGAKVTDIAILVVAADDGVMPQTVEAINHAKAAKVSIIVAINKIDKPGANVEKIKQQLTEYGLVSEEWGGDVICVPVSAKNRENIDTLLEMVLLTADMLELKSNPDKQAKGTVIEALLDKNKGAIATLLVQRGTLRVGDSIVSGTTMGRIRAMINDKGLSISEAGPSMPVEITGLPEVPEAGETFYVIEDEKVARQLVEKRRIKHRQQQLKSNKKVSLEDLFNQIKEGQMKELNIIVKADVQGSIEAIRQSLEKLSNEEVKVKIVHGAVGAVTESDVNLAEVSNAIIIGFNVRPGVNVSEMAENAKVDLRMYRVIYEAIDDVKAAMEGMLEPSYKEVVTGHSQIRQIFKISGIGTIAGCYMTDGKIIRSSEIRLVRDGIVIHEGHLASLKRFKDDVKEVVMGYECGMSIENYNDLKEGDIIEAFQMEEVKR